MEYLNNISEELKKSILNRVCETSTGLLAVPTDIVKRVRKETGTMDPSWLIRAKVQNFANWHL